MNKLFLLSIGVALLSASCTKQESEEGTFLPEPVSQKFVNTKAGADISTILFKAEELSEEIVSIEGLSNVRRLFTSHPGKQELESKYGLDRWYEADICGSIDRVSEKLASISEVSAVEFNTRAENYTDGKVYYPVNPTKAEISQFNDPYFGAQWGLANNGDKAIATSCRAGADINVKDVWAQLTCGDPSIVIAICDEGVKYSHEDLKDNMWVNEAELNGKEGVDDDGNGYVDDIYGANFTSSDPKIFWDKDSHGTHCAGIVAAVNNNGKGVCGVAGGSGKGDGCRIMSCQIMSGGKGSVAWTAKGIKYAADMGASIISCSFGYKIGTFSTDNQYGKSAGAELAALRYFEDEGTVNNPVVKGGIIIFASGNDTKPYASYPGALADVISVSAMGPDNLPTYYTNYGPGCNIVAPGGEAGLLPNTSYKGLILSTVPEENDASFGPDGKTQGKYSYGYSQGTSMACPFVSGVAALGLSYAKKLGKTFDHQKFKEMIVTSANDIDDYINSEAKQTVVSMTLKNYYHKMGTGSIDAWLLMMKIEGIPSIIAEVGQDQPLSISEYFGTSSKNLTYLSVEVSPSDSISLGLTKSPYMKYGKLFVSPSKIGSGKIKVTAVGGGTELGGGDKPTGGMEVSQVISVVSRGMKTSNGRWM